MRFDGVKFAEEFKKKLKPEVEALIRQGKRPYIASLVFKEDETGLLYTRLKKEAADELGIIYEPRVFSFLDSVDAVQTEIKKLNKDSQVTGIMIQKPTRRLWEKHHNVILKTRGEATGRSESLHSQSEILKQARLHQLARSNCGQVQDDNNQIHNARRKNNTHSFNTWWQRLVSVIEPEKDIDGLSPTTLAAIKDGTWEEKGLVPPATAKAVFKIVNTYISDWPEKKIAIIGKSDLVGKPLYYLFRHALEEEVWATSISCRLEEDEEDDLEKQLVLLGKKELNELVNSGQMLKQFDIVISATGRSGLINASMVKEGVALIDVGEPKGDVHPSAYKKASLYTPVPGGVGPVTVVSLMENGVELAKNSKLKIEN